MQTGEDILFTAPGPDFGTIPTASTEIVGTPGNALNVYWIVTHFPIGSVLSGPFPQKGSPNVLDDNNYILISWLPTPGASSYDLLVTSELQLPKQPGRFLLEANLTSTQFRDRGETLDFYDVGGIRFGAPQEEHIFFDNRTFTRPRLRFIPWPIEVSSLIFEDGSEQNTAGGGGLPAPPDQSVQFNNNGAFGGSPDLLWDGNNLLVGPPNVQNFPTPDASGRILSVQGSSSTATVELSSGAGDGLNEIIGNFLWIDKNRIAPSNDAGVIRVLTSGVTPFNRGTRMEFFTRIDGSIEVPLPGPHLVIDQGLVGINMSNPQARLDVTHNDSTAPALLVTGTSNNVVANFINPINACNIGLDAPDFASIKFVTAGVQRAQIGGYDNALTVYAQSGTASITVLGNGNVGIKNPNPTIDFHVNGVSYINTVISGPADANLNNASFVVASQSIGLLAFGIETTPRQNWIQSQGGNNDPVPMLLNPLGGNVGINTFTPQAELEVVGFVRATYNSTSPNITHGLWLAEIGGPQALLSGGTYGNYHTLNIDGNPLLLCRPDLSNALVGIGLLDPKYKLDIADGSGAGNVNINGNSSGIAGGGFNDPIGFLGFSNKALLGAIDQRVAQIFIGTDSSGPDSGVMIFQTANAGVLSEHMRINSQGRIDITGSLFINGIQVIP